MKKIILIILILFLTGCYNYKELNKIGIVSSISIDKDNNEYLVGAQVMNIKEENTDSSKVIIYTEKGNTIEEALRKMTKKVDKKLFGGHLSKLVISEEVAKESIINVIDLFQRLPEIKTEFNITVSKNIKAIDVIKVMTSSSNIPANFVKDEIDSAYKDSGIIYSSKLDEFVSFYLKKYIDPVVAVIKVENYDENGTSMENTKKTDPETRIILSNIGITSKGKLEKYLDEDETIGYNLVRDNINELLVPVKCDKENYASISIIKSKTDYIINNNYNIEINVNSNGNLNEYNCNKDLDEDTIKELENKTESKLKDYINKVLEVQNNSKSEFLGLKRLIYLEYPNYNNEKYKININTNVNISRKGELMNSIKGEENEE